MMINTKSISFPSRGFTLVELAIVLVVVGLLLTAFFTPLTAQLDLRNNAGTKAALSDIKEALYGYAVINNRLPCPARAIADPTDPNYGMEDITLCAQEGLLPWKTLGVRELDEWGQHRTSATSPWIGYWRYRVDTNFSAVASFNLNMMSSAPIFNGFLVRDSFGNPLTPTTAGTERPIAIVYSTGKNLLANGQNASLDNTFQSDVATVAFDDILIWLSRPSLLNKMVSASKLP